MNFRSLVLRFRNCVPHLPSSNTRTTRLINVTSSISITTLFHRQNECVTRQRSSKIDLSLLNIANLVNSRSTIKRRLYRLDLRVCQRLINNRRIPRRTNIDRAGLIKCGRIIRDLCSSELLTLTMRIGNGFTTNRATTRSGRLIPRQLFARRMLANLRNNINALSKRTTNRHTNNRSRLINIRHKRINSNNIRISNGEMFNRLPTVPNSRDLVLFFGIKNDNNSRRATRLVHLFVRLRNITSLDTRSSNLRATSTTTSRNSFLHLLNKLRAMFVQLRRHKIGDATKGITNVVGKLNINRTLMINPIRTTIIASSTKASILRTIFSRLNSPYNVHRRLTNRTRTISRTIDRHLNAIVQLRTTNTRRQSIRTLLSINRVLRITIGKRVRKQVEPMPKIMNTIINIRRIVTHVLRVLNNLFAFFRITTSFNRILTKRHTRTGILRVKTRKVTRQRKVIIPTNTLSNLSSINNGTVTIFGTTTVTINTLINMFRNGLIRRVTLIRHIRLRTIRTHPFTRLYHLNGNVSSLLGLLRDGDTNNRLIQPTKKRLTKTNKLMKSISSELSSIPRRQRIIRRRRKNKSNPKTTRTNNRLSGRLNANLIGLLRMFF